MKTLPFRILKDLLAIMQARFNLIFIIGILLLFNTNAITQITTNYSKLKRYSTTKRAIDEVQKRQAQDWANLNGYVMRKDSAGVVIELQFIDERGMPQYYIADNANSAKTMSTNKVYNGGGAGLSLDGIGVTTYQWDVGSVRSTHQEFDTRVSNQDAAGISWHSTHVAGTIVASGVKTSAKGMAFAASLKTHDWNYDDAEMAMQAADGMLLSNHSYSYFRGWKGSKWLGDTTISKLEDYKFGFYDELSKSWDEIVFNAPYYLIIKSAGNDRDDVGDGTYPPDGPYDCIGQLGIAKNILTVGAVSDITAGYSQPSDVVLSGLSSCGPADDGRIKPDIVANGVGLFSTTSDSNDAYRSATGTSMSTPSVTGSVALLIQQYENIFGSGNKMRASTMKALIINTADEAGDADGPDYEFGWGLMNTESAALKITDDLTVDVLYEGVLDEGETFKQYLTLTTSSPIRATLVWTDPPGNIPEASVDPADTALVNNLNLTLTDTNSSFVYYPWKLDKDNPEDVAVKGENYVDNVEQVDISNPTLGHVFEIEISHSGNLLNGRQAFSLVLDADFENDKAPVSDFYSSELSPRVSQQVDFFDASLNIPTSWSWSFSPNSISYLNSTTSLSKNPQVEFTAAGVYTVSLYVQNSFGDSTKVKTNYIVVDDDPGGYCQAYSHDGWGYIMRLQFCGIDNSSDSTNVGDDDPNDKYYEDWTSVSTQVVRGQSRELIITNSVNDPEYTPYLDVFAWIDWNRDGDFWDEGELVVENNNDGGGGTFTIDIPINAELGNTRMRVRTHYNNDLGTYPCGNTDFGEVEDYSLEIIDSSPIAWLGTIDTNWNNANNWNTSTVPDFTSDVTIPSTGTTTNFPAIGSSQTAECNSMNMEINTKLVVDGVIKVYGR